MKNTAKPGTDEWYRLEAATDEVSVDADAVVSHGEDNGAYVQCWVWVDAPSGKTRYTR